VFVVNYETFSALTSTIVELSRTYKIGFIADEMQKFKNPNAQRTKAALKVAAACVWRLGLTGSPVLQGGHDVWAQWYVVDLGTEFGASFVQFKREFFVPNEYTMELYPRRGSLDEIGTRMRKRGVRYATEDCLDLPPVIDLDPYEVDMTREQLRAYVEMEDELITQMDSGELATAATQLVSYLRLMQITSGHVTTENGAIHLFNPNPKLDLVEEVVRDNINAEQIIVWAHFRPDMDMLTHRFRDLNPAIVRGGMSLEATDRSENQFRDGTSRLFLGQPGAGGLGLNLQAASLALYYSMSYSLEDWLQSRGRCHRAGSEIHRRVAYGTFRCRGTIDDIVFSSLTRKESVANIVVNLREHIRQRLLT
jgi:SNF2 family DNA or RNA helicase